MVDRQSKYRTAKFDMTAQDNSLSENGTPSAYLSKVGKSSKLWTLTFAIAAFVLMLTTVALAVLLSLNDCWSFSFNRNKHVDLENGSSQKPHRKLPGFPAPTQSLIGNYTSAVVAADNGICSEIGRNILMKGGNAVDAAIAAAFCIGVMDAHSSGIGGGHLTTIYLKKEQKCLIIDARETAPSAATVDMYVNRTNDSKIGWRAVGVPGEIYGLYKAWSLAGSNDKVKWRDLVMPTAELCIDGYPVSGALAKAFQSQKQDIMQQPSLRSIFVNPLTDELYEAGDLMKRPRLGATLIDIANSNDPIQYFYNSSLTVNMTEEFRQNNGIITLEDFQNYTAKFGDDRPPVTLKLTSNLMACGPPPPSSASITLGILNILSGYGITPEKLQNFDENVETYHRVLEAMKFAYAERNTFGDMDFVKDSLDAAKRVVSDEFGAKVRSMITDEAKSLEYYYKSPAVLTPDHGTSHISVIDQHGNAVALTATINLYFGARVRSSASGVIWNDEMDDFSTQNSSNYFGFPASSSNFIVPGKRPMSSMSPIVVYDTTTGNAKIVAGAAGGSRIISATAQLIMRLLWFGQNVKEAIESPRLHHQLLPFQGEYEQGFPKIYLDRLMARGQNFTHMGDFSTAATAIAVGDDGRIYANSDFRKAGGYPAGF